MAVGRLSRTVLFVAAIAIVCWSFFDVGRRAFNAERAVADRPIILTVLHWGDPSEDHILEVLTRQYMDLHPRVQIIRVNPGATAYSDKLKTMFAAGTPPDVFYLQTQTMPELASLKLIMPLDKYFAAESAEWRNDIFPLLLDAFRFNTQTGFAGSGGQLFGIPKDFTTTGFFVNVDLFQKAGLRVPYDGWTWDEFEADTRRITDLSGTLGFENRKIYGSVYEIWADSLRALLWSTGGDFFGPGGFRDVALESPQSQAALQIVYRTRLVDQTSYNVTGLGKDGSEEFFAGNIGCDGPVGRWKCPRYKDITSFKWDFVPAPRGTAQVSQCYTNAWACSSSTKYPDQAWDLIRFFTQRQGQIMAARLGLAIPCLKSVAFSPDFLSPPGLPPMHAKTFLDLIADARLAQLPRQAEFTHIIEDNITKSIQLGQESTMESAQRIKGLWLADLNSPLQRDDWPAMPWRWIVSLTILVVGTILLVMWWRIRRSPLGPLDRSTERAGWAFILPWVIGFLALTLGPMVVSLLLSFAQWTGMTSMGTASVVGLTNYTQLLAHDQTFYQSLKVTLVFVVLAVPIGQVASLAVALLMNTRVRGIAFFRTVYFVPSVVSGVALATLWMQVFNSDYGLLNKLLRPFAHLIGKTPPDWFGVDAHHWAVPAFVIMGLWGVGSGMIIYLAGLKGIPPSLYEASTIDGAGPARRLLNVTLPMLSPLIFYNLVMGIIGSFQIFTQAYVMTGGNGGPDNATLFYVLSLYRQAFVFHNMGYASAMAWVLFVIVLGLTLLVFRGSKRFVYYEGLRS